MAKRQVIESVCDRCHTAQVMPLETGKAKYARKDTLDLPKGWLHVSGVMATATVFALDLCTDCKVIVMEAAGRARLKSA